MILAAIGDGEISRMEYFFNNCQIVLIDEFYPRDCILTSPSPFLQMFIIMLKVCEMFNSDCNVNAPDFAGYRDN